MSFPTTDPNVLFTTAIDLGESSAYLGKYLAYMRIPLLLTWVNEFGLIHQRFQELVDVGKRYSLSDADHGTAKKHNHCNPSDVHHGGLTTDDVPAGEVPRPPASIQTALNIESRDKGGSKGKGGNGGVLAHASSQNYVLYFPSRSKN